MQLPEKIRIVEVGPRDGLQNEKQFVPTLVKLELIERLVECGLTTIEATAFVSPRWTPQMADHAQIMAQLRRLTGVRYPVLAPNLIGLEAALKAGATEIAVFASASESFSQRNINCSIAESLQRYRAVASSALAAGCRLRGYVSCTLGCPYGERIEPQQVAAVATELQALGCEEISLGDTIGLGTPKSTVELIECVAQRVPLNRLAGHFHDTRGLALANVVAAMTIGITVFDSSIAGLGGCPYAPGAAGNVATEDLVWLCDGMGIHCGVDFAPLAHTGAWISRQLGRETGSKAAYAWLAQQGHALAH